MEARTIDFGGIGWAVNHLRHGHRMRRSSWPPAIWVAFVPEGSTAVPQKFGDGLPTAAVLMIGSAMSLSPWTAAHADLLAGDWEMAEPVQPGHTSATAGLPAPPQAA